MTENAEQTPADGGTPEAPAETPAPTDEGKNALRAQLAEYGKTIKEQQALLEKFNAAEAAKAEAAAIERGEFDKLIADRDAKLTEAQQALAAKDRAIAAAEAKALLTGLNKLELKGALAEMPPDVTPDGVADWVAKFKTENAELFTPDRAAGVTPGASGEPHRGTPAGDLKARLKSTDPEVKGEANKELLKKQLSGEIPMNFVY